MAEKKTFPLRLSPELFDAIQRIASQEFRSVNGQMEKILTEYVKKQNGSKVETESEPQE
jgi:hypothetical protein